METRFDDVLLTHVDFLQGGRHQIIQMQMTIWRMVTLMLRRSQNQTLMAQMLRMMRQLKRMMALTQKIKSFLTMMKVTKNLTLYAKQTKGYYSSFPGCISVNVR
jgi:hypothetical protein